MQVPAQGLLLTLLVQTVFMISDARDSGQDGHVP